MDPSSSSPQLRLADGELIAFGRVIQGIRHGLCNRGRRRNVQWEAEEEGCHRRRRRDTKAPMGWRKIEGSLPLLLPCHPHPVAARVIEFVWFLKATPPHHSCKTLLTGSEPFRFTET
ncbi:hypothetical protein BHE74_00045682 [Ensete ventricosum]|nr:hypothetical protein BHE74_00045682 [Ensete ventricosum]